MGRSNIIRDKRRNIDTMYYDRHSEVEFQQCYDYPGSDEPSDSFIQMQERFPGRLFDLVT